MMCDKHVITKQNTNDPEYCITCGSKTEYLKGTPIVQRLNYTEGSGQQCQDCVDKQKEIDIN